MAVLTPAYPSVFDPAIPLRGYQMRSMEAMANAHDGTGKRQCLLEMATAGRGRKPGSGREAATATRDGG